MLENGSTAAVVEGLKRQRIGIGTVLMPLMPSQHDWAIIHNVTGFGHVAKELIIRRRNTGTTSFGRISDWPALAIPLMQIPLTIIKALRGSILQPGFRLRGLQLKGKWPGGVGLLQSVK
jgi:hypothetical protein